MRWVIKNPAPTDSRLKKWGDYHLGRSLSKYLERLGQTVITQHHGEWGDPTEADVVLHLRGKYPLPAESFQPGALHVMWNISHPDSVEMEEYERFDLLLVASRPWAEHLAEKLGRPVAAFLQCTDGEEFYEHELEPQESRRGFVFVGNTREVRRDVVLWAIELGVPVRVWGRGWGKWIDTGHVVDEYYPNEQLAQLYSRARVSLNDHWPDMKEKGFINNRIFDALACGLPVISDSHPALCDELPDELLLYSSRAELAECIEEALLAYPSVQERARDAQARIRESFTFARRAEELIDLVSQLGKGA